MSSSVLRPSAALLFLAITLTTPSAAQDTAPAAVVRGYIAYTATLLGLRYSPAQEAALTQQVHRYWATGARSQMEVVQQAATMWGTMQQVAPDVRLAAAATSRADVLIALRTAAAQGDADSQWLLDAYHAAHPPIAPGAPDGLPLVAAVVDARLELDAFMAREIHRRPAPALDAAARRAAYQLAATRYARLSGREQRAVWAAPGELASTQGQWARMGPELRTMVRQALGAPVAPHEVAAVQRALGQGPDGAQARMLGSALQHMRETTDIIMGRGTVWNPAAGRWEQQGGIVTEFNGTVRVP